MSTTSNLPARYVSGIVRQPQSPSEVRHLVSAPALHAARILLRNFTVDEKQVPGRDPASIPVTEYNLALLIDLCTDVFRLEPFRSQIGRLSARVHEGKASQEEVAKFLRDLNVTFNWMPTY
jgi:hypothetical protein